MNTDKADINIRYFENTFAPEELLELENEVAAYGFKLTSRERSYRVLASIDFFVPVLEILLSSEMVSSLRQGMLANAAYDAIKHLLTSISHKFSKKYVFKVQSGQMQEKSANIHFVVGNNRLVLPVTADDEKFRYVVDRFMDISAASMPTDITYTFYSEADDKILIKTEEEIIRDECENQKKQKARDL